MMQYSDFPMPSELPTYPQHWQIAAYYRSYADHYDVTPRVLFRRRVRSAGGCGQSRLTRRASLRRWSAPRS